MPVGPQMVTILAAPYERTISSSDRCLRGWICSLQRRDRWLPPVPLCYCFDYTAEDLRQDLAARGKTEIPAIIAAEVKAGHCACEVKNPQGSCCLGSVTAAVRALSPGG